MQTLFTTAVKFIYETFFALIPSERISHIAYSKRASIVPSESRSAGVNHASVGLSVDHLSFR